MKQYTYFGIKLKIVYYLKDFYYLPFIKKTCYTQTPNKKTSK